MSESPPIPLAVYVHFPWCVSKCPYCDFNSHALRGQVPESDYLASIGRDLEQQVRRFAAQLEGREVVSVFLGGGTPSLFSPAAIGEVLGKIGTTLSLAKDAEVTLEANPGTIERGRFAEYAAAGVNRVSLGAQSFDPQTLQRLGRIHRADDTRRAAEELHAAGLARFNLDLMYGLPAQDAAAAERDLAAAIALAPAQISHYHLTLEPGTPFAARPPADLPTDETTEGMLELCQRHLAAAGFERYEVSAYARAGQRCRHNLVYWKFGDYLGLGAGAHGKLSGPEAESGRWQILRTQHLREPRRYQRDPSGSLTVQAVPESQRPFEFMLNALRLLAGAQRAEFESRTGLAWATLEPVRRRLEQRGLLQADNADALVPTALGLRFLNEMLLEFLPK